MTDQQPNEAGSQPVDPTGRWRWDGTQWVPTAPSIPTTGTPPPAPKQTAPWWRKAWVLPTGVGVLALLVGIAIGSASAGTKTKTVAGPERVVVSASPSPVPTTIIKKVPVPGPVKVVTKQVPQTYTQFGDGTYVVGTDIQPGVFKTAGPNNPADPTASCYWAVLNSLNTQDIADNGNISGPTTIQVSGKALEVSGGCTWARIG